MATAWRSLSDSDPAGAESSASGQSPSSSVSTSLARSRRLPGAGTGAAQHAVRAEPEVVEDRLAGHALHLLEHGGDPGGGRRARRRARAAAPGR